MNSSQASEQSHHLPQQVTSFVGRDQELSDINRRLTDPACRLLTLVGPGGIGKTRLAIQVVEIVKPQFPDGIFFINLQPVQTEELMLTAIADALDISISGQDAPLDIIRSYLTRRDSLLTLDNFEQLLDISPILSALIVGTRAKFLITSRETLNLQEEWLYPVNGMRFPSRTSSVDELAGYDAIQLFGDRAKQVQPDFSLENEAVAVARICRLVEGMPLALELAAPWIKSVSCSEIADEIERNQDILSTRLQNVPERHRNLQAIFTQSWKSLNVEEQDAFQRLAVFRGGFTREAAMTVAGASLPLLSSLLDKSLLRWETKSDGRGRYQIHELLRQFAEEKLLKNADTADETLAQQARYFAGFLAGRLTDLLGGRQIEAMLEIEAELANIRVAWVWAVEQEEWSLINDALETFHLFSDMQGRHWENVTYFQLACEQLSATDEAETRQLLGRLLSRYRFMQVYAPRHPDEMETDLKRSLEIAREAHDNLEIAFSMLALGGFSFYIKGDSKMAKELFEQGLEIFRRQEHKLYEARTLTWLAVLSPAQDDAIRYSEESLAVARACGDKLDMLVGLSNLADMVLSKKGDYMVAEAYCDEAISTADEMRSRIVSTHTKTLLSMVYFLRGDWNDAMGLAQEGLTGSRDLNNGMAIGYAEGFMSLYESMMGNAMQGRRFGKSSKMNQANHKLGLIVAHWGLATAHCEMQDYDAGLDAAREGLYLAQSTDSSALMIWLLPVTAVLYHYHGNSERAVRLLALASAHHLSQIGWEKKWTLLVDVQAELKQELEAAASEVASLSAEAVLSEIKKILHPIMTEGQYETNLPEVDPALSANQALIDPLTNRELDVLQLIAEGLSNRQIAEKLIISTGTAKYYTSQIYRKLQVTSRTQAIVRAREQGVLKK